jgi:hypothetical protein
MVTNKTQIILFYTFIIFIIPKNKKIKHHTVDPNAEHEVNIGTLLPSALARDQ